MELGIVKPVSIVEQMADAYLDYSMSVIVSRALPDVRDGLKPVHRRVLYAMNQMGMHHNRPTRKSAGIVGEVLKLYHPHGDAAVYDTLVRMAQPWSLRYPLVVGQGNFGSIDDDPPAAMRYTEAKMAAIADELLQDIDKDTVDFVPNYDNSDKEPSVLPAKLPNLLLNGATGIAVGMATNIPPHNLGELCDGIIYLIDHPEATVEELGRLIKGPDFPTGGIIQGHEGIRNAYASGRGRIVVRAKVHTEETERGKVSIVVTEIPYMVNKADLVKKISELARDKKIDGITDVRDESDRQGIRMVIDLRRDARSLSVLNQLFKYTAMQSSFGANMLALVDNQPRVLTLKSILQHYITHREQVITRRTQFELAQAKARLHILEGLKIALDHIDAVIATIRGSDSADAALMQLQSKFGLSEEQAKAILDMQLRRLAALERKKIEDEIDELRKRIAAYEKLLSNIQEIRNVIKQDLAELKEKYGDPRRSEIQETEAKEFSEEDLIPNDEVVVTLTVKNYIKRLPTTTYRSQRRGGKGVTGMVTHDDDAVNHLLVVMAHDSLLLFTNRGRVFHLKAYELPDVGRTAKGEHIRNLVDIVQGEIVTAVICVPKFEARDFMVLATKFGEVKKTSLEEFANVRRNGLIAMNLEDGDELRGAKLAKANEELIIVTANAKSIRFPVKALRNASRTSGGVRGVKLNGDDELVSIEIVKPDGELLIVTTKGYGKRTPLKEYPSQARGGGGVFTSKLTPKIGKVAAGRVVSDLNEDLVIISAGGTVIRQGIQTVAHVGRATQGVRLMNMGAGDYVVSVATAGANGEEEIESE